MLRLILAMLLAGLAAPAVAQDAPPDTEAGCLAAGGRWARGGMAGRVLCYLPTPDAGSPCASADDCTGICLAETRTCSAETPMFGCVARLGPDGATVVLCLD